MRHLLSVLVRTVICLIPISMLAISAHAQFRASVEGTVKDVTGAVVSGAMVSVKNQETARTEKTTAGENGFYRVAGLPPGKYTIEAEAPGFRKKTLTGVTINAEETQGIDIRLEAGPVAESVTVTAGQQGARLDTEEPSIARSITTEEVQRLPQVGRDPYELVRLTPGVFGDGARSANGNAANLPNVTGPGGSNTSIFQVENQVQVSANGQRVSANDFQIDGVSVNSLGFGGAAVVTPNQESVKEMRVLSSTYSAEDGRNSGAQIKVVSQNGTNSFHGSGVFKYNDPALNAFNKYGGPGAQPVRVDQFFRQYAASLGGPVVKDKLFFFFSYEGLRNNSTNFTNAWVETPQYRQLIIADRPNSQIAQVLNAPGMLPRVVNVISAPCSAIGISSPCQQLPGGLDIGSPTGSIHTFTDIHGGGLDGVPDIQFVTLALPNLVRGNQYNGRVDYNFSSNNQFAVSTYFTNQDSIGSDAGGRSRPIGDLTFQPLNSAVTLTFNHVFSASLLNEARLNFTRFAFNQLASNPNANFGIPRIEVEGLPFDRIRFGADRQETTPAIFAQNTYEFRDIVRKVVRTHALSAGFEIRKEQDNSNLLGGARPVYSFVGLFNLANESPVFEAINVDPRTGLPADAQRYFRTSGYGLFFQDDWKFRPNLTLNLGLRWEYFTPLKEKNDQLTNLMFGPGGFGDLAHAKIVPTDQLFQADHNNFAPRIGFAWSPRKFEDKLVIRGGFGIAYNRTPDVLFANTRGNPPFFARFNLCCAFSPADLANTGISFVLGANNSPLSFPVNPHLAEGINPATGAPNGGAVEIWGAEPHVPNAYIYLYSLDTEYALPYKLIANLGYQGSSSHKLIRLVNQNFIFTPSPAFFAVFFPQPDVNANYNALNARLSRQFSKGLEFSAYYRFAKSIDTLSYEGPGAATNQTNPRDLPSERGPSDFDVRHYFVASALWDLPIFLGRTDLAGKVLGGWEINTIFTYHTGFPWTPKTGQPISSTSPNVSPARPTAYLCCALDDSSNNAFIRPGGNFPGGGTAFFDITHPGPPGIGRNSFRGPKYRAVDFSLVKRTGLPRIPGLGEGAKLELRANLFNAFNNLNLIPFGFFSAGTFIENSFFFGRSDGGLAGRVVELQVRFSF
jgi:hypothetical protein